MKMNAMLNIIPIGVGVSLSNHIAACERVLMESELKPQLHAHGTNIEGDWDEVMGAPPISTSVKLGTRTDRDQSMDNMVRSVQQKLEEPAEGEFK